MLARARRTLLPHIVAYALALASQAFALAQETNAPQPFRISYKISMPRPASHLFEVELTVETETSVEHIDFQTPRWSPGRYAVFDFAKNVQEVGARKLCAVAQKCDEESLAVERVDTQTWRVRTNGARRVRLSYKVFADDLSGTFSQLDERHANFNGGSVFMYVAGRKQDPVSLKIEAPEGWKIVNGYSSSPAQNEFEFPNYDVLIDAPTEIAPDWTLDEFKVRGKTYRVVIHSFEDGGASRKDFVRDVERVVRAHLETMPEADYDAYTFLFHFDPTASRGDGMEHLNSTQIVETQAFNRASYMDALETASHEFFHVWLIKRLRPAGLGPWDFTAPVVTRGLWIGEGFTNYYGKLMLRRAGVWRDEELFDSLSDAITEIEASPGSRLMSAEEASLSAPFIDRASHEQRTNLANTSVSYYPKGETLALVLDLLIRAKTGGRASLDDVMRRAYSEFYMNAPKDSYYLRGRAFAPEEFERIVSEVAGADMSWFFERHARRPVPPPYDEALAFVGLRLARRADEPPHDAGISLDRRDPQTPRIASVRTGSPAEAAGLRQGDALVKIGDSYVTTANWRAALNLFRSGERVPLVFRRARKTVSTALTLGEPDAYVYRIEKIEDAATSARRMREAWTSK